MHTVTLIVGTGDDWCQVWYRTGPGLAASKIFEGHYSDLEPDVIFNFCATHQVDKVESEYDAQFTGRTWRDRVSKWDTTEGRK